MGASSASMIARAELRRRWGSLLGVAALVAVLSAAVLTAAIGAHRSATAVDRFRSSSNASDLEYQSSGRGQGEQMLAAARADGAVERSGLRYLVNVWPTDRSADIAVMSDPDDVYGTHVDRPQVLQGRMPAADAPNEIMLNSLAAQVTGLHVGDRIDANSWSETDLDSLSAGEQFPGYNGPHLQLVVVGIGRTADELSGTVRRTSPYAVGSPAFLAAHPKIGAWPPALEIRLHDGSSHRSLDSTVSRITERALDVESPGGFHTFATSADDVYLSAARKATDSLVVGLLLFAAAAAVAGGLAVGQAVQRQLAGSVSPSATLVALGLTRTEIARARSWPIAISAALGAVLGIGLAVVASPLLPIGLVRRAEIHPGLWFDPLLLAVGAVLIVGLVWLWALVSARFRARLPTRSAAPRRTAFVAGLAARAGSAPSLATGLRMAGDRGSGTESVPVRSVALGAAIAVAAILASGVVAASYGDLAGTPAHWGVPWSSSPDYFGDQSLDKVMAKLARDERVESLGRYTTSSLVLNGEAVSGTSLDEEKGQMHLTRLEGRLPRSPTEIALGARTLSRLRVAIGDTVSALPNGGVRRVPLTVVGTVVLPATDEYAVDVGAVVTPPALRRFGQGDATEAPVLGFRPHADVVTIERGLAKDYGFEFSIFTEPRPQGSITSLADSRDIAVALAVFLGVVSVLGMLHVLLVSSRRGRSDLGVLRALGLRGRQAGLAVIIEGLAIAVVGLFIGIPAGVIAGRAVWRNLVSSLGVVSEPRLPWVMMLTVVPAVVLVVALLSWWPARRVRRASPVDALRVE